MISFPASNDVYICPDIVLLTVVVDCACRRFRAILKAFSSTILFNCATGMFNDEDLTKFAVEFVIVPLFNRVKPLNVDIVLSAIISIEYLLSMNLLN